MPESTATLNSKRTRARWALGALLVVNAVMVWFIMGMTATVNWATRALDDDTVRACVSSAIADEAPRVPFADDFGPPRYVDEGTVRFAVTLMGGDGDPSPGRREIECKVGPVSSDSDIADGLVVLRATVVQ